MRCLFGIHAWRRDRARIRWYCERCGKAGGPIPALKSKKENG